MYSKYVKRVFDLIATLIFIIILSPFLLAIALILAIEFKGSPFFIQCRPGFRDKPIYVIKFKTMTDDKDAEGNLLPNTMRITKTGRFLRNYSLDELPQLFNILKADMSCVGPRPLLFKYIPLYSKEQSRRNLVKPGITGMAQVHGRNAISWTKKFEYDIYYVDHLSFILDLKILYKTVKTVLTKSGVNAGETVTMPPFNGKN